MNRYELRDTAREIEDLRDEIAERVAELAKLMKSVGDISYTAEVVETNIYAMLGVNGYYNAHNDVQSALDYIDENEDNIVNGDDDSEAEEDTDAQLYQKANANGGRVRD